jgi:hypothetical protein
MASVTIHGVVVITTPGQNRTLISYSGNFMGTATFHNGTNNIGMGFNLVSGSNLVAEMANAIPDSFTYNFRSPGGTVFQENITLTSTIVSGGGMQFVFGSRTLIDAYIAAGSVTVLRSQAATVNTNISTLSGRSANSINAVGLTSNGQYVTSQVAYISTAGNVRMAMESVATNLRRIESTYAPTVYVDTQIASLINSAPAVLDTLKEIATALGDDPAFATTITTLIANEASTARAAELVLTTDLAAEVARAVAAEGVLTADLAAEVARATDAEGTLTANLSAEIVRATAAESVLTADLAAEVSRATAADYEHADRLFSIESILNNGTDGQVLKLVDGNPALATNDTAGVSLTSTTNFPGISNLQQAIDYLFNFTQIRKVVQHVVNSSTAYGNSVTPNADFAAGRVHFINYNAANTSIYLPPAHQNATYANGTVYRIVHNGAYTDGNLTIKYRSGTINPEGTAISGSDVSVIELAPRDTISLVWNAASSSYLAAVGI